MEQTRCTINFETVNSKIATVFNAIESVFEVYPYDDNEKRKIFQFLADIYGDK